MRIRGAVLLGVALAATITLPLLGADSDLDSVLDALRWRNLGPFRAGASVSAIAVPEGPPRAHSYTMYIATRTGGLWRSTNNGTTFDPIFDATGQYSIGAVALAPSHPETVWVGTGGADNARSAYSGAGVFRSLDGGGTWQHMGLRDAHHIARIVVHPTDPRIVWVAAMGHLFSANEERGVFKTEDGGRSWHKVLYLGPEIGVIDLVINRDTPEELYAATYEKHRYPWHFEEGGPGSGIFKSTDSGESWSRLNGGLPEGKIGRIGLDIYRRNPNIVYAVVENANLRPPTPEEQAEALERGDTAPERIIGGEVYRSDDAGETWVKMNRLQDDVGGKAAYSFNQIRVAPDDDQRIYVTTVTVANSEDGGRTWADLDWPPRRLFPKFFGDVRALWIDPLDSRRIIAGTDGGVHVSYDGGATSDFLDNLPLGEVYAVGVDMEDPYNVYAGLQDHECWKGPSNSWSGQVSIEDWITVCVSDGMYNSIDPADSRWLYNTRQFGGHLRVDQRLRRRTDIMPRRPADESPYRFTWVTPIVLSPHRPAVVYTGAQVLLRSSNRGDTWEEISPDLTSNDPVKIAGRGHIQYCTITTISESPLVPGVIWVGTDDGRVWVTRDHGASWSQATDGMVSAGAPRDHWVSRVVASSHRPGTAYVTKNGRRRDDHRASLFRTTDYGATWEALGGGLQQSPINVVFEDRVRAELLYVGNDRGVSVSIDRGASWAELRAGMPRVPVHDLVVHPRENDLVVGTYGRGIWITDVTVLQQLTPATLASDIHLFEIEPKGHRVSSGWGNYELYGDRHVRTPNEPAGIVINYWLRESAPSARLVIRGDKANVVGQLQAPANAGLNTTVWSARVADAPLPPGVFEVTLEVAGVHRSRSARICATAGATC